MLIIADAHLDESIGNTADFFHMLDRIALTSHDVVLLGDTFDLWIGLDRYETPLHRDFLAWCKIQKTKRTLGFVEGNHEYFIADERCHYFTWCSQTARRSDDGKMLFCHGDMINAEDVNYLHFRKLMKNRWTKALVRPIPLGPALTKAVKRRLKTTNLKFRQSIPSAQISKFAERHFQDGIVTVFSGHFHETLCYSSENNPGWTFYTIPPWYKSGEVGLYNSSSASLRCCHWKEIPRKKETRETNLEIST
jgi:UDP-2,3-diacylglucosamine hydrolase